MKSGTQNLKMNNMNSNPINNKFQKYDENQINEAKESMKLLQSKIGSNLGQTYLGASSKNTGNNLNYNSGNSNNNNNYNNSNNSNYRKPFKPNFESENMQIQVDTLKNMPGTAGTNRINAKNPMVGGGLSSYKPPGNNRITYTSNTHRNNSESYNENNVNSALKQKTNMNNNNNVNFNYQDPDDDRPAVAKSNVR